MRNTLAIPELLKAPGYIIKDLVKPLNNAVKRAFPWCDSGCNDCKYFEFNGKWGNWGGKIRFGKCKKPRIIKLWQYRKYKDELDEVILATGCPRDGLVRKDWMGKKVIAIPNYAVNMRCFKWRRQV